MCNNLNTQINFLRRNAKEFINSESKKFESPTPLLDFDCLLCNILKKTRSWLIAHDDFIISENDFSKLQNDCALRQTGLPVAYITNHKEFYGFDFYVDKNVLIPKPDTELLVEKTIEIITSKKKDTFYFADICTGSGCVGLSIIKTIIENSDKANIFLTASDISEDALNVAIKNSQQLLSADVIKKQITFSQSDLFNSIDKSFDLIVSNPPYVPAKVVDELLQDGRNEPRLALDGDIGTETNGMTIISKLIPQAYDHLFSDGTLIIETGEYNAEQSAELMKKNNFTNIEIFKDLSGLLRVVKGVKK